VDNFQLPYIASGLKDSFHYDDNACLSLILMIVLKTIRCRCCKL